MRKALTTRPTLAELHLRRLASTRSGDLLVLALERALVRDDAAMNYLDVFMRKRVGYAGDRPWAWASSPATAETTVAVRHVSDWIEGAVVSDAAWLHRTDDEDRPLKLMKIGSLDRAVAEADKAIRTAGDDASLLLGGEKPFGKLDEDWSLVQLTTPQALDFESSRMQHCIGNGAYDSMLKVPSNQFLSLRDPQGKPHATIQLRVGWKGSELVQLQGKQNRLPLDEYVVRLSRILDITRSTNRHTSAFGYVTDAKGVRHDLESLPDTLVVSGDLILDFTRHPGIRMPRTIRVTGGKLTLKTEFLPTAVVLPRHVESLEQIHIEGAFSWGPDTVLRTRFQSLSNGEWESLPALSGASRLLIKNATIADLGLPGRLPILEIWSSNIGSVSGPSVVGKLRMFACEIGKPSDDVVWSQEMNLLATMVAGRMTKDWPKKPPMRILQSLIPMFGRRKSI